MGKYLVTGGAGFIGSSIVEALLMRKKEVRVLDNFLTGKKANLADFKGELKVIEGDIRDAKVVQTAVQGVDFVIHLAALPSVQRSVEDPILSNEINVNGTLNILKAARDAKVKRVVYASSSSVYGGKAPLPVKEIAPVSPISPYGISKLTAEFYCRVFYEIYGLETVSLRYFNVFGPRQDPKSQYAAVIPKFITAILNNQSPEIYGDGEQSRDFTFVYNVVEANLNACAASRDAAGKFFNIACGDSLTLNRLVDMINSVLGKNIAPIHMEPKPGDIKHSLASIKEAKKYINYEPSILVKEGLKRTIDWFRK